MDDQRIGRLIGEFGAGDAAALQSRAGIVARTLIGGLRQSQALDADG